jgi:serine/threonine protein kinase
MSFIGQHVALFNSYNRRFVQMRGDKTVGVLDDSSVNPGNLESWRDWERFLVVDAGYGEVAFFNPEHQRFLQIRDERHGWTVGVLDEPSVRPQNLESWRNWERFRIVDAGNGKYALHNAHHNRFVRVANGSVDGLGGPKDVNKLPPESEWGSERFEIVQHPFVGGEQGGNAQGHVVQQTQFGVIPSDYEVIKRIAEGYWGETFQARSKSDGGMYCIKRFKYDIGDDTRDAIKRELNALKVLPKHPNILSYNHSTIVDKKQFTICEYIESQQLIRQMPVPDGRNVYLEANILSWTKQLLCGLECLHKSCIVHRDLHMGNILIRVVPGTATPDTGNGSLKIIDVGNCKLLTDHELHTMTHIGGTMSYFSPERVENKQYNEKDDVWAAACIVSELVTGRFIKKRPGTGTDGCLFTSQPRIIQEVIDDVKGKSVVLGRLVECILSARDPEGRRSASQVLKLCWPEEIPLSFCCSITGEVMLDPVVCADGHSYERAAIQEWFARGNMTSPLTNGNLSNLSVIPNHELRSAIEEFMRLRRS